MDTGDRALLGGFGRKGNRDPLSTGRGCSIVAQSARSGGRGPPLDSNILDRVALCGRCRCLLHCPAINSGHGCAVTGRWRKLWTSSPHHSGSVGFLSSPDDFSALDRALLSFARRHKRKHRSGKFYYSPCRHQCCLVVDAENSHTIEDREDWAGPVSSASDSRHEYDGLSSGTVSARSLSVSTAARVSYYYRAGRHIVTTTGRGRAHVGPNRADPDCGSDC